MTHSLLGIATPDAYRPQNTGSDDLFLLRLNAAGIRQWATYYGGPGVEGYAQVALDLEGNIILSGQSNSETGITSPFAFRTQPPPRPQPNTPTSRYASFIVKFSPGAATRLWATYYSYNALYDITCDTDGSIYVTGQQKTGAPYGVTTPGAHLHVESSYDATNTMLFLSKFSPSGYQVWGTMIGGNTIWLSRGSALALDRHNGYIYVGGGYRQ